MFKKSWGAWLKVDPVRSLADLAWSSFLFVSGLSVASMTAWASTTWDWYWQTFQWAGIALAFLAAWILFAFGVFLVGFGRPAREVIKAIPSAQAAAPSSLRIATNTIVLSPPNPQSLVDPSRFYSRAEKERIVDTMNLIQQGFNDVGRKMMWEAEKVYSNPGQNDGIDQSIVRMRVVSEELGRLSVNLEKIRNESDSYPVSFVTLLAYKPVYYDEFQRAVYDYSNALTAYRHFLSDSGEHRGTLAKVLDSSKRHLSIAKHHFEKWMDDCDGQMRSARRLLEK